MIEEVSCLQLNAPLALFFYEQFSCWLSDFIINLSYVLSSHCVYLFSNLQWYHLRHILPNHVTRVITYGNHLRLVCRPLSLPCSPCFPDDPSQGLDSLIHYRDNVDCNVQQDDRDNEPSSVVVGLWVLVVKVASEQEAWVGHCQDAHLVEDL